MNNLGFQLKATLAATLGLGMLCALPACSISKSKSDEKKEDKKEAAAELADDAVVGSCQAKDNSFCDEYRNRKGMKDDARNLDVQMSKGACEGMKDGVWREAKACEPKGEIGHCAVDKPNVLKQVSFKYAGDEEMAASACKDLMDGQWASGLADDVVLGSCQLSSSCRELRNNKKVDAESRARDVKSAGESCDRLEGQFAAGKACQETEQARAKCTKKGDLQLTTIDYETSTDKEVLSMAKETCGIGEGTFETLTPAAAAKKKK